MLCDAATLREGLLHVLGGGITVLYRDSFPAPLALKIVVVAEVLAEELAQPQKITVTVENLEGAQVFAVIEGDWESPGDGADPNVPAYISLIIGLERVAVPAVGYYRARIDLDGVETRILPFQAKLITGGQAGTA